ncbi:MAG: hypothetical protein M5U26_13280 [Planctomycetota bacterium]|nr:hypothetical protein [Planctomycetota bacterium]
MYDLLNRSIDEQISAATESNGQAATDSNNHESGGNDQHKAQPTRRAGRPSPTRAQYRRNGNGNGNSNGRRRVGSTDAQRRAIFALCREQGIEMADVLADFNVTDARDLSVMDASKLIDDLKARIA